MAWLWVCLAGHVLDGWATTSRAIALLVVMAGAGVGLVAALDATQTAVLGAALSTYMLRRRVRRRNTAR
ncbi:hypothetical protein [Kibdelosporangium phytohabitans]|uniref:Uncharacterized protein n=1 Tax=Kibdelosporangium phytohabitans TaxID=860235 RepID=A0A0N9HPA4_9PSEU|nr:hypothetical protein [Kibdelosporangium phytohabitans]ALG06252.1 hypothetical protein AOZ06_04290 [Kibdelosporangium phytohabitans]MBE1467347.1 hypothetical protein [Kibdelosporangium phytohabitans]